MRFLSRVTTILVLVALTVMVLPTQAQDTTPEATAGAIALVPHSDDAFGIESVVPEGWADRGNGLFARATSPDDVALVAQQAAPLNAQTLLSALLPQLALTEAPEPVGTYSARLDWTLYQVNVDTAAMTVKVDLALAEAGGKTYLLLVQGSAAEYDDLHTNVFLPILDAYGLTAAPTPEATEEPLPYHVEDVTFTHDGITLAGTLTLPPTAGPHPAIVLVSGSGPQDRDEGIEGIAIKPFRLLADGLTRAGVAVLRYDDRGVGESTGDFTSATTDDFATDAEAAIAYLISRDDIDAAQVGLLGHSEGGMIAAILGARNEDLAFIISLAGPAANIVDLLVVQGQRALAAEGAPQEQIDAQTNYVREMASLLDDPEAMETLTYEHTLAGIAYLSDEQRAQIGDPETYARTIAEQTARQFSDDWFRSFMTYNPATDWAQTTIPVLAIFGGNDVQVDAAQNAPAVTAALAEAGNNDYVIVVLPDANHLFQAADTGAVSEYMTLPPEFTPNLLPTIIGWLQTHLSIPE